MTVLSDIAREFTEIGDNCGNSWDAMSEHELTTMAEGLSIGSFQCSAFLVHRCGDDVDRASVQVRRAMDLLREVLGRRAREAEAIIQRGDTPNLPQTAAWIAIMLKEMQSIGARIERKQAGAVLN